MPVRAKPFWTVILKCCVEVGTFPVPSISLPARLELEASLVRSV
jgi:hypothetical protein